MRDQRGLSLIELLVGALLGTIAVGAMLSFYSATARTFGESSAQAALQRQGTLALEEISRKVRGAASVNATICSGSASVLVAMPAPGSSVCFYPGANGELCEWWDFPSAPAGGNVCRNLLAGGMKKIVLLTQPAQLDDRCPAGVQPGQPCFSIAPTASSPGDPNQVDLAFAIRDDDGDQDGRNITTFRISLTCSGRNC